VGLHRVSTTGGVGTEGLSSWPLCNLETLASQFSPLKITRHLFPLRLDKEGLGLVGGLSCKACSGRLGHLSLSLSRRCRPSLPSRPAVCFRRGRLIHRSPVLCFGLVPTAYHSCPFLAAFASARNVMLRRHTTPLSRFASLPTITYNRGFACK
jgi:hypothetical protein